MDEILPSKSTTISRCILRIREDYDLDFNLFLRQPVNRLNHLVNFGFQRSGAG